MNVLDHPLYPFLPLARFFRVTRTGGTNAVISGLFID